MTNINDNFWKPILRFLKEYDYYSMFDRQIKNYTQTHSDTYPSIGCYEACEQNCLISWFRNYGKEMSKGHTVNVIKDEITDFNLYDFTNFIKKYYKKE